MKTPSSPVEVSCTTSAGFIRELWLSAPAMILMCTSGRGGETDPSIYNPRRPKNKGMAAWQPSCDTAT